MKNLHLCTTDNTTPEILLDYIPSALDLGTKFRQQIELSRQKKGVREFGIDVAGSGDHLGDQQIS